MENFLNKHAADVIGVLSGFDRLVFRGTLRLLARHLGLMRYLRAKQVLLKDFASQVAATIRLRGESGPKLNAMPAFSEDCRKFWGHAATATGGCGSLTGRNLCPKSEPRVPL